MTKSTFTLTDENFGKVVRETLSYQRLTQRNYDAMVAYYGLTPDTESGKVTESAHDAILRAYPGTDPADLKGKDKNHLPRWVDARKVRKGLVDSIKRQTEGDDTESEPRVTALLTAAGRNATVKQVIAEWEAAQQNN